MPEEKVGRTPQVSQVIQTQRVHVVNECRLVEVSYVDGYGDPHGSFAIIRPNGEVRFLDERSITKPASTWLSSLIVQKLGVPQE